MSDDDRSALYLRSVNTTCNKYYFGSVWVIRRNRYKMGHGTYIEVRENKCKEKNGSQSGKNGSNFQRSPKSCFMYKLIRKSKYTYTEIHGSN